MKKELMDKLQAPFSVDEISFRVTNMIKEKSIGKVVAYVSNSAIQKRLDDVFGPFGWQVSFKDWKNGNAQLCTISIYDEEKQQWISKEDGAPNTDIEPIKGGISDSMKRCARMYGIGRYLASDQLFKNPWAKLENKKIIDSELARFKNEYNQYLSGSKAASKPTAPKSNNSGTTSSPTKKKVISFNSNDMQQKTDEVETNNNVSNSLKAKNSAPVPLINAIKDLITQTNTDINNVLNHYKIANIEDLTIKQANNAIALLSSSLSLGTNN